MRSATGLLTRGSLPRRLPGLRQWLRGGGASPLTAAGPSRIRTGFPHRAPDCGRAYHRTVSRVSRPSLASRRRLGGADLRVLVGAGPRDRARRVGSRAAQARARGRVRDPRRAPRPRAPDEPAWRSRSARSTRSATRCTRRSSPAGTGRPLDVAIDAVGVAAGVVALAVGPGTTPRVTERRVLAIELDAIGDTRPLWVGLARVCTRRCSTSTPPRFRTTEPPRPRRSTTRAPGTGVTLLERFAEDHAPAYLRRDAATSAALQSLAGAGVDARRVHRRTRAARARCALPARRDAAHLGGRDRSGRPRATARRPWAPAPRSFEHVTDLLNRR